MITRENYTEKIKEVKLSEFSASLRELHDFFVEATENGTNWSAYDEGDVKYVVDAYFEKLNYFVNHLSSPSPVKNDTHAEKNNEETKVVKTKTVKAVKQKKETKPQKQTLAVPDEEAFELVERLPDEIRFIKRYLSFNGKRKTKEDFLRFINAIHRAIYEKKVSKTSPFANQIRYIEKNLIKVYNTMGKSIPVEINSKTVNEFKEVISSEKVMPSIMLIKRYINLNGKYGVKDKAKSLLEAMERAWKKNKVLKSDKYTSVLDRMYENLKIYTKSKSQKILSIQDAELNGLNGILSECGCHSVSGLNGTCTDEDAETYEGNNKEVTPAIMSSMDFKNLQFETIGFKGKFKTLIGDPSKGFTAMVFGKPKMGKSFLCVDFASYLAPNHGKVLYVAKEEGFDMTFQQKLKSKNVAHPNLFIAEEIPDNLADYDFVFLDSVNKLGLSAQDLETLKRNNPTVSFIYIFQTTKEGNFKGANEFQHDVDVVIEVREKGKAVQNGRFNQGGEMNIF